MSPDSQESNPQVLKTITVNNKECLSFEEASKYLNMSEDEFRSSVTFTAITMEIEGKEREEVGGITASGYSEKHGYLKVGYETKELDEFKKQALKVMGFTNLKELEESVNYDTALEFLETSYGILEMLIHNNQLKVYRDFGHRKVFKKSDLFNLKFLQKNSAPEKIIDKLDDITRTIGCLVNN